MIKSSNRSWGPDDSWMAFALFPLICRTVAMIRVFDLRLSPSRDDQALSQKLLLVGRVFYALFLWSMKLCLLRFYKRLETGSNKVHYSLQFLRAFIVSTFFATLVATLFECFGVMNTCTWASIEIVCSSVVANASFYYAIWQGSFRYQAHPAASENLSIPFRLLPWSRNEIDSRPSPPNIPGLYIQDVVLAYETGSCSKFPARNYTMHSLRTNGVPLIALFLNRLFQSRKISVSARAPDNPTPSVSNNNGPLAFTLDSPQSNLSTIISLRTGTHGNDIMTISLWVSPILATSHAFHRCSLVPPVGYEDIVMKLFPSQKKRRMYPDGPRTIRARMLL
ncbi:conserved hypothetical protein [Histoplasma capsulatum G186AR]|uniref:Rhodopsin domain-containing protein n=1 Tax=Ajellomyces capsulatus (strain G186AR / H82 / ATCC MYA-2454 / RMSCC 2432) TaxID=447093 RepID=C0NL43_AJECG|nr:uncharacterized protein HCBG_03873 [Histoplasma capsulatum G186AR]EEH08584.1 conserved hypothetical protein [Histoplasma capsulatum G186AR]